MIKVTYDPHKIQPPPLGGFTLSVWNGPSMLFMQAGEYEVPDGVAKHPDWTKLIERGAIALVVAPAPAKAKSTSRAKHPPDGG